MNIFKNYKLNNIIFSFCFLFLQKQIFHFLFESILFK